MVGSTETDEQNEKNGSFAEDSVVQPLAHAARFFLVISSDIPYKYLSELTLES